MDQNSVLVKALYTYPSFGFEYLYTAAIVLNSFVILSTDRVINIRNKEVQVLLIIIILSVSFMFNRRTGRLTISPVLNSLPQIFAISILQLMHCVIILFILEKWIISLVNEGTSQLLYWILIVVILWLLVSVEFHLLVRNKLTTDTRTDLQDQLTCLIEQIDDFRPEYCTGEGYIDKINEIDETAREINKNLNNLSNTLVGENEFKSDYQEWFSKFKGFRGGIQRKTLCDCVTNEHTHGNLVEETRAKFDDLEPELRKIG